MEPRDERAGHARILRGKWNRSRPGEFQREPPEDRQVGVEAHALDPGHRGTLDAARMREVDRALAKALDLRFANLS